MELSGILSNDQREKADRYYAQKHRKLFLAYLAWFFGGFAGLHRHYLHKNYSALWLSGVLVLGSLTVWLDVGVAFLVFGIAVWISDGMRLPLIVRKVNQVIKKRSYAIASSNTLSSQNSQSNA